MQRCARGSRRTSWCRLQRLEGRTASAGPTEATKAPSCLTLDDCRSWRSPSRNIALNRAMACPMLTSIVLTAGPCATGDANPPTTRVIRRHSARRACPFRARARAALPRRAELHVAAFIYSTDVTFTTQTHPVPKGCVRRAHLSSAR